VSSTVLADTATLFLSPGRDKIVDATLLLCLQRGKIEKNSNNKFLISKLLETETFAIRTNRKYNYYSNGNCNGTS